jgi:hypothetical protein
MSDGDKVIRMPGVSDRSAAAITVDETLESAKGCYDRVLIIGRLPDGSHELVAYMTCADALWMIERAKRIVMD